MAFARKIAIIYVNALCRSPTVTTQVSHREYFAAKMTSCLWVWTSLCLSDNSTTLGIFFSTGLLLVPSVSNRKNPSAAWYSTAVMGINSKLKSDNWTLLFASPPVESAGLRIDEKGRWSVRIVNLCPSRQGIREGVSDYCFRFTISDIVIDSSPPSDWDQYLIDSLQHLADLAYSQNQFDCCRCLC